ncbi:MAG: ABC transporter substrate-binding protein [Candidatus Promineifilaceae bacterium]
MDLVKTPLVIFGCAYTAFLFILVGCAIPTAPTPEPITVTEVYTFEDGAEFVVTRVITDPSQSYLPTPIPTIPIPESLVELDVGILGGFRSRDPQLAAGDNTLSLMENLYVGLTRFSEATGEIEPQLATDWNVSADGLIWTFNLRNDVFWVQAATLGEPVFNFGEIDPQLLVDIEAIRSVVAQDVVFAIQRACNRRSGIPDAFILFVIEGCEAIYQLANPTPEEVAVVSVKALDDHTLEVRLREPIVSFLAMTTLPVFRPIPADRILDEDIDWLEDEDFVTSGPFVLSPVSDPERELAPVTILQRNPHWPSDLFGASPDGTNELPERVNLYQFRSTQSSLNVFDDDFLDLSPLPRTLISDFIRPPFVPPTFIARSDVYYVGFNFDSPAFSLPKVRRAFSAAIDRERLLREVYSQSGLPLRHLTPPTATGAPPYDEVGVNFSPDFAFFELANSGYVACQTIGDIRYLINATDIALQHAESLIRMWVEELGCAESQFKIEQVQFGTLLARTQPDAAEARPDLFDLGWSGFYPDSHDYLSAVLHCRNGANRQNRPCEEIDGFIDAAVRMRDPADRAALYRRIEADFFSDDGSHPIIPLYADGAYQLVQDWIVPNWTEPETGEAQIIGRFSGVRYDSFLINQTLKLLERSQ